MRTLIIGMVLFASLQANSANLRQAELALNWKPEPEFGGFYEAQSKKLYEANGLKVEILPGGSGQPVAQMVASKKVLFGIASAEEILLARSNGAKIVGLFAVYQDDPQGFMVHSERKITNLKQLFQTEGTIAIQKGMPFSDWLQKKYAPIKATLVPYSGGITQFLKNKNFAQQCFVTSEPIAAKREKQTPHTLLISESGYNPYLAIVIAHEETLRKSPELVKQFLKATQAGWQGYLKNPKDTNLLMNKLNPSITLEDLDESSKIQKTFIETLETKTHGLGYMSAKRWDEIQSQLLEVKVLKSKTDSNSVFKILTD